jgi:quercetin dioxygenase-like cupin family protein
MRAPHEVMRNMSFPHVSQCVMLRFMNTPTNYIVNGTSQRVFMPRSPGVEICVLRRHPEGGLTFLVRLQKGARAERHGHPGGEETYVVSGRIRIDRRVDADEQPQPDLLLSGGDHFFAPVDEIHEGFAEEDCILFVVAPGGVGSQTSR